MDVNHIDDDEIVYRRIPRSSPWFENAAVTSANFDIDRRRDEQGISVYRARIVTAAQVLAMPGAISGSLIAQARVGDVRSLRNGRGDLLKLDVVPVDDTRNPGHAEIRVHESGRLGPAASKALRDLFKLL